MKDADAAGVGWWLYSVSPELGSYVAAFKQARIDGPKLLKLSDRDMQVNLSHAWFKLYAMHYARVFDVTGMQAMGMRQQHREAIIDARTDLLVSNALAKAR